MISSGRKESDGEGWGLGRMSDEVGEEMRPMDRSSCLSRSSMALIVVGEKEEMGGFEEGKSEEGG